MPAAARTRTSLSGRLSIAVEGLTPGYFALVMATGIVSVGLALEGFEGLSRVLLGVCVIAFATLVTLTLIRFVRFRHAMAEDFFDPKRAFGYFTYVAGTNVLGVRLFMEGFHTATAVLLVLTALTWAVLGYVVPWTAVLGKVARPVVANANGTWFIWVVASQSVAVASATLEPVSPTATQGLAVLAVVAWSVGVFLYAAAGMIVTLRMLLYDLRPEELNPPYWVAMGASAITVLAGARIVEMASAPMVDITRGLVAGLSVMFWAFATWLIPVLFAAGVWRHWVHKVPLRYEATLWSICFPLGMYAVAGIYLGRADGLPLVGAIGRLELWLALAVVTLVMVAMVRHLVRSVLLDRSPEEAPASGSLQ